MRPPGRWKTRGKRAAYLEYLAQVWTTGRRALSSSVSIWWFWFFRLQSLHLRSVVRVWSPVWEFGWIEGVVVFWGIAHY